MGGDNRTSSAGPRKVVTVEKSGKGAVGCIDEIDGDWDSPAGAGCREITPPSLVLLQVPKANEGVTLALDDVLKRIRPCTAAVSLCAAKHLGGLQHLARGGLRRARDVVAGAM